MDTLQLLQQSLGNSLEAFHNSAALLSYCTDRLSSRRKASIDRMLIGKIFTIENLLSPYDYFYRYHPKVKHKAILSDIELYGCDLFSRAIRNCGVFRVNVYFLGNPEEVLFNVKGLTARETQLLKEAKTYWKIQSYNDCFHYSLTRLKELDQNLSDLKHQLRIVATCSWDYHLDEMLAKDFLTKGLKAEISLF